jgi:hypothetical protein
MTSADWRNFAAFVYNIYLVQPTAEFFHTSYATYCKILNQKYDLPLYITHEAAARIITMCRIGINLEDLSLCTTIRIHSGIFKSDLDEVWQFWLQQLVELARIPWFCDIARELFEEMSYRFSIYAKKDNAKSLDDEMNRLLADHPPIQIHMMEACQVFANDIFEIDFEQKDMQERLFNFALETQKLEKPISKQELLELRRHTPIDHFSRALYQLTMKQIESIGNFESFYKDVAGKDNEELCRFVQGVTQSAVSLKEVKTQIRQSV